MATIQTFEESLNFKEPPTQLSTCLKSLWYDRKGDWHTAHDLIDELTSIDAAWLHAYLHRKEGDMSNADYWYRRAGRKRTGQTLDEEQKELIHWFLSHS